MTHRQVLKALLPGNDRGRKRGGVVGCPTSYRILQCKREDVETVCKDKHKTCRECWGQESKVSEKEVLSWQGKDILSMLKQK